MGDTGPCLLRHDEAPKFLAIDGQPTPNACSCSSLGPSTVAESTQTEDTDAKDLVEPRPARKRKRLASRTKSGSDGHQVKKPRHQGHLACPCYLLDRVMFGSCDGRKFDSISHVKQHLRRNHMCKRCSKIQEAVEAAGNSTPRGTQEDDESQHDHIMSPITATVSHAMRGKSKANMPVEKQYSDLWSLIFPPGTRSPPSPFIDSILLPRSLRPYRPFLARSIPGLIPPMRKQKDVFFRVLGCKDSPEPNEDDMRIFNNSLLDLLGQVMWEAEQEMCPAAQGTPEKTKVQDSKSPDSSFITLLGDSPLETSMTYDAALAVDPPEDKPNLGDLEGGGISHLPAARGGLERQITSPEVNVHGVWATLDAGSVSFGHHGQAMGGSFAQGD